MDRVDIIVGTFGKALASLGAFAVMILVAVSSGAMAVLTAAMGGDVSVLTAGAGGVLLAAFYVRPASIDYMGGLDAGLTFSLHALLL